MIETTTSDVLLPTFPHATDPNLPQSLSQADESATDRRILIVDDEAGVRAMFAEFLCDGYECETAASADEALAKMATETYALVLSDMMMPGRNGVELLREITFRYPDTAVIMVSGIDRPQRVRDALRVGAFDYLIKPCELDVLTLSVERALERRSLQRTARVYKAHLEKQNIELATRKSELERLQGQLVHTEKMASLGQLAAGIAHELNNPAGFVYGNMDLLRDYLGQLQRLLTVYEQIELSVEAANTISAMKHRIGYERLIGDLDSIISDCREGSERICDVVKNLRLFSRLDEAEVKQIEIHGGIDSTIRLLSRYFSSSRITVKRDYGTLPLVSCYAGQLNEVWMNLLANAAQSISGKGEVGIATRLESESVVVEISDTGIGIPEDNLSRIFDPFFTTKPVGEGTGLGLSISYGIIERHGGTITATSRIDGGTTFIVKVPIEPAPGRSEQVQLQEVWVNDIQTTNRR
jgi:two-component system, NtrC family, sensor kinase